MPPSDLISMAPEEREALREALAVWLAACAPVR